MTINNQYYIDNCLKSVIMALEIDPPKCGAKNLKILYDNARPHTNLKNFLTEHGIELTKPTDIRLTSQTCRHWLFSLIKSQLLIHSDA